MPARPLILVAQLPAGAAPQILAPVRAAVERAPGVESVSPPPPKATDGVVTMLVIPTTSQQDAKTLERSNNLRDNVLPEATRGTGIHLHIGGPTALFADLAAKSAEPAAAVHRTSSSVSASCS